MKFQQCSNTVQVGTAAHAIHDHSCVSKTSQHTSSDTTTTRGEGVYSIVNDAYSSFMGNPASRCSDTQMDHVYEIPHQTNSKEQPQYNTLQSEHGEYELIHDYDRVEERKCVQQCEQLSVQLKSNTDGTGLDTYDYVRNNSLWYISQGQLQEQQVGRKVSEMELLSYKTPYLPYEQGDGRVELSTGDLGLFNKQATSPQNRDITDFTNLNLNKCLTQPSHIQITLTDTSPCLLYTSPSPRDATLSRMPSSA